MVDFDYYLRRKYEIMQQEANAKTMAASKGMVAPTSSVVQPVVASTVPTTAPAVNQNSPVTGVYTPSSVDSNTSYIDRVTDLSKKSSFLGEQLDELGNPIRAKKGLTRVPGKGDGKKDTVKARLAPGEAVLNKAAADGMGRGLIAALNKVGAQKMGLV